MRLRSRYKTTWICYTIIMNIFRARIAFVRRFQKSQLFFILGINALF
jgi:hypothetical protein